MDMQNIENQFTEFKSQLDVLNKKTPEDKLSMVVFSGDLDKVIAAFVIATGAVAMGMEAVMFFTFWGTPVLRDEKKRVGGKDTFGKMFGAMLPKGAFQDEHGRHGYGHDEIAYEKEERGVFGAISGNGGRIRRANIHLRDVHGSNGF
jgi:hypothetical protein